MNYPMEFEYKWPADLHLIGKDIIRFHTIYWPCFLMSMNLELPKQIFGHPWLLMNSDKMSKSKGNIIYADDLVDKFGVDAVRFYLLKEIPFASDGNISYELIIDKINGELANILGNLVQRTISMGHKYFNGKISNTKVAEDIDNEFIKGINDLKELTFTKMDSLQVSDAITEIFNVLRASNKYIDETMPWVLAKDSTKQERLETVLYNLLEAIRVCAVFLEPFMPSTSDSIMEQLNCTRKDFCYLDDNAYDLGNAVILFQRIDKDKFLGGE